MNKKFLTFAILLMALLTSIPASAGIPIPNVDFWISDNYHRAGVATFMEVFFRNKTNKPVEIRLDANPFESNRNAVVDGEYYSLHSAVGAQNFVVPAGETVKRYLYVDDIPTNAKEISSVKVKGKTNITERHPEGYFEYEYIQIPLPKFPASNKAKCYFLDTQFDLTVDKVVPNGRDLEIVYTLTNNGKRDKKVASGSHKGKATDEDGDEYEVEDSHPYIFTEIPSGESESGKLIIKRGANRKFKKIRLMYDVNEIGGDNFSYPVLLQLDGAQSE